MTEKRQRKTLPPKSCYVMLPLPAILNLANSGQRAASRVLYALCLHLGPGLDPVYPSYLTISKFAYISENGIRKALNVLVKRGYVSIEKTREGRKTTNYYTVLDKAYTEDISHRSVKPREDSTIRICTTCYEDVSAKETFREVVEYWAGKSVIYRHTRCWPESRGELLPASPGIRWQQEQHWAVNGRSGVIGEGVIEDSQSL